MKENKFLFRAFLVILAFIFTMTACEDEFETRKQEPKIDVQESVASSPQSMRQIIQLTSSYPWYAEASSDWINLSRYRGQALKPDSIIFTCDENYSMDDRVGWIEVRLMDQLTQRIEVIQKGRGSLITLPQSLVYFNRQGGEVMIDVVTHLDWEPEVSSKDGFSFTKVGDNQLKIVAAKNATDNDKTAEIKLLDKDNTTDASLSIIQKPTDKILFIPLDKDKKDLIVKRGEYDFEIPVTLNVDYEVVPSTSWITAGSAPNLDGTNVQNVTIGFDVSANLSGMERDGYVVIRDKTEPIEASDTIFIAQRGKSQIIYVKPNGNGDGSSWEYAFGSIHDAMNASSVNGDLEIWVASGEYQFPSTLTWKHVNVYGGFSGTETKFKERDLRNKPVFLGGKFNFMNAWTNNEDITWMDGIIFADCDNYENTSVGCFEIYENHGFRNCEFRNIRHGNAVAYLQNCVVENTVFTNLETQRYLVRGANTMFYNVTVANSVAKDWNSNYIYGGSKLYNSIFWNIKILQGERYRALVIGGDVVAVNCAIQSGINEKGLICTDCIELDEGNSSANGPNFVNPTGETPDFKLNSESVLIDAGNSNFVKDQFDIVGNKRIIGSSIDIGAYEYDQE